jgi:Reverse transcriptase (RNA-dependent DNA polymerase)
VLQVLEPIFEPTFHPAVMGFRSHRGAHTAIAQAKEHLTAGYQVVVDLDLSKFFDCASVSFATSAWSAVASAWSVKGSFVLPICCSTGSRACCTCASVSFAASAFEVQLIWINVGTNILE